MVRHNSNKGVQNSLLLLSTCLDYSHQATSLQCIHGLTPEPRISSLLSPFDISNHESTELRPEYHALPCHFLAKVLPVHRSWSINRAPSCLPALLPRSFSCPTQTTVPKSKSSTSQLTTSIPQHPIRRHRHRRPSLLQPPVRRHPANINPQRHTSGKTSIVRLCLAGCRYTLHEFLTLQRRRRNPRPLGGIDAEKFISALGSALAHLHALGRAHNDVNPSNVTVDDEHGCAPVLIDFDSCRRDGEPLGVYRGGWSRGRRRSGRMRMG